MQEFLVLISLGITRVDTLSLNDQNDSKVMEFELTQHVNEAIHFHGNSQDLIISPGLNFDSISVLNLLFLTITLCSLILN